MIRFNCRGEIRQYNEGFSRKLLLLKKKRIKVGAMGGLMVEK